MSYNAQGVEMDTPKRIQRHDHRAANDWIRDKFGDLHFLRRDDILRKIRAFSESYYLRAGGTKEEFEQIFDNQTR